MLKRFLKEAFLSSIPVIILLIIGYVGFLLLLLIISFITGILKSATYLALVLRFLIAGSLFLGWLYLWRKTAILMKHVFLKTKENDLARQ